MTVHRVGMVIPLYNALTMCFVALPEQGSGTTIGHDTANCASSRITATKRLTDEEIVSLLNDLLIAFK